MNLLGAAFMVLLSPVVPATAGPTTVVELFGGSLIMPVRSLPGCSPKCAAAHEPGRITDRFSGDFSAGGGCARPASLGQGPDRSAHEQPSPRSPFRLLEEVFN